MDFTCDDMSDIQEATRRHRDRMAQLLDDVDALRRSAAEWRIPRRAARGASGHGPIGWAAGSRLAPAADAWLPGFDSVGLRVGDHETHQLNP
jgi:hypothetical protein